MILSLSSSGVWEVDGEQSPPVLNLQEGVNSPYWCNFSISTHSVNWCKNPGGCLIHLVYVPLGTKQDGRLNATAVPTEHRNSLHIFSSQTTDLGTYFCAAQHGAPQAPAASTWTLLGLSPSSSLSHTVRPLWGHHKAFALLSISYLHWYSYNHKHFLTLQIWDLVFSLVSLYLLLL